MNKQQSVDCGASEYLDQWIPLRLIPAEIMRITGQQSKVSIWAVRRWVGSESASRPRLPCVRIGREKHVQRRVLVQWLERQASMPVVSEFAMPEDAYVPTRPEILPISVPVVESQHARRQRAISEGLLEA